MSSKLRVVIVCITCLFGTAGAYAQIPSYGCRFLPLIFEGINLQNSLFREYLQTRGGKSQEVVISEVINVDQSRDKEYSKHNLPIDSSDTGKIKKRVFDDLLFHMKKEIVLVDTFNLFSNCCQIGSNHSLKIINELSDTASLLKSNKEIVVLKYIWIYENLFKIGFQHVKSNVQIDFSFRLLASGAPELVYMRQNFHLSGRMQEWYR